LGSAYDYYIDTDAGTITVSDTVTTSFDSFTLLDTHWVSGYESSWFSTPTETEGWLDYGTDENVLSAQGTENATCENYTFVDTDSSNDEYVLTKAVPGQYNVTLTQIESSLTSMSGTTSTGPLGGSYSYVLLSTFSEAVSEVGDTTYDGIVTPFSSSQSVWISDVYHVSGPPVTTATVTTTTTSSSGTGRQDTHRAADSSAGRQDTHPGRQDTAPRPTVRGERSAAVPTRSPGFSRPTTREPRHPGNPDTHKLVGRSNRPGHPPSRT
jgi:hypothetical protein